MNDLINRTALLRELCDRCVGEEGEMCVIPCDTYQLISNASLTYAELALNDCCLSQVKSMMNNRLKLQYRAARLVYLHRIRKSESVTWKHSAMLDLFVTCGKIARKTVKGG